MQTSAEHAAEREFTDRNVGRGVDHVAILRQHLEAPVAGFLEPALDAVELAEDHVDRRAIEREPPPAVHDRPPFAQFGHVSRRAQPAPVSGSNPPRAR